MGRKKNPRWNWVDEFIPLLYGNNGSLDPMGTYATWDTLVLSGSFDAVFFKNDFFIFFVVHRFTKNESPQEQAWLLWWKSWSIIPRVLDHHWLMQNQMISARTFPLRKICMQNAPKTCHMPKMKQTYAKMKPSWIPQSPENLGTNPSPPYLPCDPCRLVHLESKWLKELLPRSIARWGKICSGYRGYPCRQWCFF